MTTKLIFFLESYIYLRIVENTIFLYNTKDGSKLQYKNKILSDLMNEILKKKNLYVLEIDKSTLNSNGVKKFLKEIKNNHFGDYYYCDESMQVPVQMKPLVKSYLPMYSQVKFSVEDHVRSIDIFLNSSNDFCNKEIIKQFSWVYYNKRYSEIKFSKIENLFKLTSKRIKVGLFGGNLFAYKEFEKLYGLKSDDVEINIHWKYIDEINAMRIKYLRCKKGVDYLDYINKHYDVHYRFLISTRGDILKADNMIEKLKIKSYTFQPFYDGNNIEFFEEHVFMTKETIFETKLSQRVLLSKRIINNKMYGKLTILPNGNVYSHFFEEPFGNLKLSNIVQITSNVIKNSKVWHQTRNQVNICKNCLYVDFCPSISNYEYALEKYDLCDLKGEI